MSSELISNLMTPPGWFRESGPDPQVLQVVRPACERMTRQEEEFTDLLYEYVAELVPGGLESLSGQGWECCQRLARSVLWVALVDEPADVIEEMLFRVGVENRRDGFLDEDYTAVGHALVRAVHELHPGEWGTAHGSAWIGYFFWMRTHLLAGAAVEEMAQASEEARLQAEAEAAEERARRQAEASVEQWATSGIPVALDEVAPAISLDDEDEDEDDGSFGQIMMNMTRPGRRNRS